ncbi:MAG: hypothetical protein HY399_06580 [Elusimicrobia bacterium]|nr:hypothetical protein [Elusimicrobiota bacterium]
MKSKDRKSVVLLGFLLLIAMIQFPHHQMSLDQTERFVPQRKKVVHQPKAIQQSLEWGVEEEDSNAEIWTASELRLGGGSNIKVVHYQCHTSESADRLMECNRKGT